MRKHQDLLPISNRLGRRTRLLAVALGLAAGGAVAQSSSGVRSIDVSYDGTTYVLKAQMYAPVPPAAAVAVLIDFPNMPQFVPNLSESRVVKPGVNGMTIEQSGTAKLGSFSFPYTSVREVVLVTPTTIRSTQVKGSMKRQQSLMTVTPEGEGSHMQYALEVVPGLLASAGMSQELLKHNVQEEFTAFIAEMVKRKK